MKNTEGAYRVPWAQKRGFGALCVLAYRRDIDFGLGALRIRYAKEMGLVKPGTYDLLWVVNFPMFDKIEGTENQYTAEHHPFTRPRDEDLPLARHRSGESLGLRLRYRHQRLRSRRWHPPHLRSRHPMEDLPSFGLSEEEVAHKFGWFIDAFKYGVPPHAGFALGLDRVAMILCGTDNIRDVEAFPKNLQAVDPMRSEKPGLDQPRPLRP
jgi:aspartyl-tRNA synthetase